MIDKELIRQAAEDVDIFEDDLTAEYDRLCTPRRRLVRLWPLAAAACVAGIVAVLQPHPISEQTSSLSSERAGVRLSPITHHPSPITHRDVEAVEEAHRAQQQEIRKKGERLAAQIQRQLTEFTPQ